MTTPISDGAIKHPNPTSGTLSKLSSKVDRLSSNLSRLGVAVKTTLNPNHRHDEEWEQEVDAKIEKIRDGHRFRSFSGERDGELRKRVTSMQGSATDIQEISSNGMWMVMVSLSATLCP
jgi:phospholipase D1/2